MIGRHRVIHGATGQKLRHVPATRIAEATFVIENLTYSIQQPSERVIAEGAAAVATWSLTTDGASGPDQASGTRIPVTATAGAEIGDPALIEAVDGGRELFEVVGLYAGEYLEAGGSLAGSYPSGSTVAGVLVTADVPDDFAADRMLLEQGHTYRVTWTYQVAGVTVRIPELVELVHHSDGDLAVGAVVMTLRKLYPDIASRKPDDETDFAAIVAELAEDVGDDLRERGIDPGQFLSGPQGRRLLIRRVLAFRGEQGWTPGSLKDESWAHTARKDYQRKLEALTIGQAGHATAETTNLDTLAKIKARAPTLKM